MRKLTLIAALLLTAAAAAHAQTPNGSPGFDPKREALRERNPTRLEEAHISAARASMNKLERQAAAGRGTTKTFKAVVKAKDSPQPFCLGGQGFTTAPPDAAGAYFGVNGNDCS